MSKKAIWPFVLISALSFLAVEAYAQKARDLGAGCFLITQKCKETIKQTKWGFEFGGVDFGATKKVGSLEVGTELIQQLTAVAQILDQMQLARCRIINSLRTCDPIREKILIVQALAAEQLGQLALLAQMYSGDAEKLKSVLLAWIVRSADVIEKIYQKQFLAAGGQSSSHLKIAGAAEDFALSQLRISPDSPEYGKLLTDPIRGSIR